MRHKTLVMVLSFLCLLASAQSALAGAEEGQELAQEWCQSCHATADQGPGVDVAPSWSSIANDPQKTDDYLRAWLSMPQGQMEHIALTSLQIKDLLAYIRTLKQK